MDAEFIVIPLFYYDIGNLSFLYIFVSHAGDLSMLLTFFFFWRTIFLFRWLSQLFSFFNFSRFSILKIKSPRYEKKNSCSLLIFFLLLGVLDLPPCFLYFFCVRASLIFFFLLSKAKHPLPSFVSVFSSGVIPYSVTLFSFSSSSLSVSLDVCSHLHYTVNKVPQAQFTLNYCFSSPSNFSSRLCTLSATSAWFSICSGCSLSSWVHLTMSHFASDSACWLWLLLTSHWMTVFTALHNSASLFFFPSMSSVFLWLLPTAAWVSVDFDITVIHVSAFKLFKTVSDWLTSHSPVQIAWLATSIL